MSRLEPSRVLFPHLGAFESTKLMGTGTDILGTTRHMERWKADLELLHSASLTNLRYFVPWHRIEYELGKFDFRWLDGPMAFMQANGMAPILDPLHHVSFPDWLDQGFANPSFSQLYARFITQVAQRYPWVTRYTVFNEPLPTTLFCSFTGCWYPYQASDDHFARMALNVAKTICVSSAAPRRLNRKVKLVHVDTCETHRTLDMKSAEWARFPNSRRFLIHDLILGRWSKAHKLDVYLKRHGLTDSDMHWLADHRASIDVLGLDYYVHSEIEWYWDRKLGRAWEKDFGQLRDPAGTAGIPDYRD